MMKRIFSALLICLFLFSMAACGEEKNAKTNDEYITIDWSIIELADKIPTPESTTGEVIGSSEKNYSYILARQVRKTIEVTFKIVKRLDIRLIV